MILITDLIARKDQSSRFTFATLIRKFIENVLSLEFIFHLIQVFQHLMIIVPDTVELTNGSAATTNNSSGDSGSHMPAIRKKERDYEGMFDFRKEDIPVIIRHLIVG